MASSVNISKLAEIGDPVGSEEVLVASFVAEGDYFEERDMLILKVVGSTSDALGGNFFQMYNYLGST